MTVESERDLENLKRIGRIVALTVKTMLERVQPGVTTKELDDAGRAVLDAHGARSAPEITYNYPGATCISVNNEAAHGIPGDRQIQPGDLVNVDVSAELDGYFADMGFTTLVPPASRAAKQLVETTQRALSKAVHAVRAGQPFNAIGRAIEIEARRGGYGLVRELSGHGVGRGLHEEPRAVWSFFNPRDRRILTEGLVFTIEPFLTLGSGRIVTGRDGWTIKTADNQLVCQFEHTLVVTRGKPVIITAL